MLHRQCAARQFAEVVQVSFSRKSSFLNTISQPRYFSLQNLAWCIDERSLALTAYSLNMLWPAKRAWNIRTSTAVRKRPSRPNLICTRQLFHSQRASHHFTELELTILKCLRLIRLDAGMLPVLTMAVLQNKRQTPQSFHCTSSLYKPEELVRTRSLWVLLPTLTHLTHLALQRAMIEVEYWHLFEEVCQHLQTLSLTSCSIVQVSMSAIQIFMAMISLSLTNVYGEWGREQKKKKSWR